MELNPVTKWKQKILRQVNGTVCIKTKFGWRSIIGMQVMIYTDKFYWGVIKQISGERVQIRIPTYRPGQDDKFFNVLLSDGHWTLIRQESVAVADSPRTIEKLVGPRCDRSRPSIHPISSLTVLLQCVLREGHNGAHHFENPSNKERKVVITNG